MLLTKHCGQRAHLSCSLLARPGRTRRSASTTRPRRCSSLTSRARFSRSCASYASACSVQPPQVPKYVQGGVAAAAAGVTVASFTPSANVFCTCALGWRLRPANESSPHTQKGRNRPSRVAAAHRCPQAESTKEIGGRAHPCHSCLDDLAGHGVGAQKREFVGRGEADALVLRSQAAALDPQHVAYAQRRCGGRRAPGRAGRAEPAPLAGGDRGRRHRPPLAGASRRLPATGWRRAAAERRQDAA